MGLLSAQGEYNNVDVVDFDGRTVEIEVHAAYDIRDVQWIGKQDPYVIAVPLPSGMSFAGTRAHTDGHRNPRWDERLKHTLDLQLKEGDDQISLQLWNDNTFYDDLIGTLTVRITADGFLGVPLADDGSKGVGGGGGDAPPPPPMLLPNGERGKLLLSTGGSLDVTMTLMLDPTAPTLLLSKSAVPLMGAVPRSMIEVEVLGAAGLANCNYMSAMDPYVQVTSLPSRRAVARTHALLGGGADPQWPASGYDRRMLLKVAKQDERLLLQVFSENALLPDTLVGSLEVKLKASKSTGKYPNPSALKAQGTLQYSICMRGGAMGEDAAGGITRSGSPLGRSSSRKKAGSGGGGSRPRSPLVRGAAGGKQDGEREGGATPSPQRKVAQLHQKRLRAGVQVLRAGEVQLAVSSLEPGKGGTRNRWGRFWFELPAVPGEYGAAESKRSADQSVARVLLKYSRERGRASSAKAALRAQQLVLAAAAAAGQRDHYRDEGEGEGGGGDEAAAAPARGRATPEPRAAPERSSLSKAGDIELRADTRLSAGDRNCFRVINAGTPGSPGETFTLRAASARAATGWLLAIREEVRRLRLLCDAPGAMDEPPPPAPPYHAMKMGWLLKHSTSNATAGVLKRWFVLRNLELAYFSSNKRGEEARKGTLQLGAATRLRCAHAKGSTRFQILAWRRQPPPGAPLSGQTGSRALALAEQAKEGKGGGAAAAAASAGPRWFTLEAPDQATRADWLDAIECNVRVARKCAVYDAREAEVLADPKLQLGAAALGRVGSPPPLITKNRKGRKATTTTSKTAAPATATQDKRAAPSKGKSKHSGGRSAAAEAEEIEEEEGERGAGGKEEGGGGEGGERRRGAGGG